MIGKNISTLLYKQRQIEAMQRYNIEKWFIEKVSGKDTNRPKLKEMLDTLI